MADITALCKRVLLIHQGGLIYDGSLDSLHDSFAPYREVRVELGANYNVDAELSGFLGKYGQILHIDGQSVCFLVQREDLTRTVSQILAELEVLDLAVSEPAIEEVIGRVFSAGTVNN
jgi:ABC-2 type transport system ATP-binding protein